MIKSAPTLVNLLLGHREGTWLREYQGVRPKYYIMYVVVVITVFNNENQAIENIDLHFLEIHFQESVNRQHKQKNSLTDLRK